MRVFRENRKAEGTEEIKEVNKKNQDNFDRITSGNEINAKEKRDVMEPYRFLKTKYIHQSKGL